MYDSGQVSEFYTEKTRYLHCNFGWRGISNGYYTEGLFNSDNFKYKDDKDDTTLPNGDFNYTWWFRVITYDL